MNLTTADLDRLEKNGVGGFTTYEEQMALIALARQTTNLAYRLAGALAGEVNFSQMPSQDSLTLLAEALAAFPDSEFAKRYEEFRIAETKAVE